MHWHGWGASIKDAYHMIFDYLDGFLGQVAAVVIRGDKFIRHLC